MHPIRLLAACLILSVPAASAAADMPDGDAAAGETIFRKCATCHHVDQDKKKIGPSLKGVIGRQAGTWDGFRYSTAMTAAGENGLAWTPEVLFDYLRKPRDYVKGTRMAFPGLADEQDRADVIAYIRQYSDPLPEEGPSD